MKNGQKTPKKLEFRLKNKENRQKAGLKPRFGRWSGQIGTNRLFWVVGRDVGFRSPNRDCPGENGTVGKYATVHCSPLVSGIRLGSVYSTEYCLQYRVWCSSMDVQCVVTIICVDSIYTLSECKRGIRWSINGTRDHGNGAGGIFVFLNTFVFFFARSLWFFKKVWRETKKQQGSPLFPFFF